MSQSPPAIEASHIGKSYGSRHAVIDVTFEVQPGEVYGLIGPNGAGKTTVLRMLVGLVRPSSGSVSLFGHDIRTEFENALRPVGAIIENPEMYKFLTGRQNLQQYARMRTGITNAQIDDTIRLVGLTDRIDEKIPRYSLGMRQRLGIAQAILHNPSLLLLDEPTNGLDPQGIQELRQMIRHLADSKGMAVLLSSHMLHDVQTVCDSIGIINLGRTVASGPMSSFTQGKESAYRFVVSDVGRAAALAEKDLWTVVRVDDSAQSVVVRSGIDPGALNETLVKAGVKVSRIESVSRSLEDAFLEMTGAAVDVSRGSNT